jgi:hypothetical protein
VPAVPRHPGGEGDHLSPRDPEAKGLVERLHDYLERSFLPGRDFASAADFNTQLQQFLARANTRQQRALGCLPADRIEADRAAIALPPAAPVTAGQRRVGDGQPLPGQGRPGQPRAGEAAQVVVPAVRRRAAERVLAV